MVLKEDYKDIIIENLTDGFIFFVMDFFKKDLNGNTIPYILVQLYCEIYFNNNKKILNDIKNNIFYRINLGLKKINKRK